MTAQEYNQYVDKCGHALWDQLTDIFFDHLPKDYVEKEDFVIDEHTPTKKIGIPTYEIKHHFQVKCPEMNKCKTVGKVFDMVWEIMEKRIPWWIYIAQFGTETGIWEIDYNDYFPWEIPVDDMDRVDMTYALEDHLDVEIDTPEHDFDMMDEEGIFENNGEWLDVLGPYIEQSIEAD